MINNSYKYFEFTYIQFFLYIFTQFTYIIIIRFIFFIFFYICSTSITNSSKIFIFIYICGITNITIIKITSSIFIFLYAYITISTGINTFAISFITKLAYIVIYFQSIYIIISFFVFYLFLISIHGSKIMILRHLNIASFFNLNQSTQTKFFRALFN